jgi:hypothetical protein
MYDISITNTIGQSSSLFMNFGVTTDRDQVQADNVTLDKCHFLRNDGWLFMLVSRIAIGQGLNPLIGETRQFAASESSFDRAPQSALPFRWPIRLPI